MTGRQQTQPGDFVASPRPHFGQVVSFHTATAGRRVNQDESPLPFAADLSNVIPFVRLRREAAESEMPPFSITRDERPAPASPDARARLRLIALAACSLVVHGALYVMFLQQPKALASVGIEAMTVEIVLGAHSAAGLATTQGESQVESPARPLEDDASKAVPDATAKTSPETPIAREEAAAEDITGTVADVRKPLLQTPPADPVEPILEKPKPLTPPKSSERPPVRKRVAARTNDKPTKRRLTANAPSSAASGIGRGRSDADSNYRGLVAAHLARHKQYPAEARGRGDEGVATVSFSLDGGGRVTAARLVRGSGITSFDQEVQAMVRRASPFPPPPGGRPMSFSVPVSFRLR